MSGVTPSSDAITPHRVPVPDKLLLTLSIILATLMQTLDSTIANVALPHIQSAMAATQDQAAWVLTSYIVAAVVMFPLSGWLANAYGRRSIFLISVAGFTIASMLCGIATGLPELVLFRLLQGITGAAMLPLSQAILFEINDPKDYGRAMSLFGLGVTLGPILGPTLGGVLTDNYSWRWVFYVNVPFGILTFAGLFLTLPRNRPNRTGGFDFFGFTTLSLAVASLQLMLDRGQLLDWFSSREIVAEAAAAGLGFYLFLVHIFSSDKPFVTPALFADRNFNIANLFLFLTGIILFATLALHPLLLQGQMHYPVLLSGLVVVPRGLGTIAGMFLVGRLVPRFDPRLVMAAGLCLTALSLWQMTHYSLLMDSWPVVIAGTLTGFGVGGVSVALSTVAFVTLPQKLRNEGTALFSLIRALGGAIGISISMFLFTQNSQRVRAALSEHVTAYDMTANPALNAAHLDLHSRQGLLALDALLSRQGAMVAYIDDFRLLMVITLLSLPCLLLFRRSRR